MSNSHWQSSGIAQGCPLSSLLLVVAMTVLPHDMESAIAERHGATPTVDLVPGKDLHHADDTLGAEADATVLQDFLREVAACGKCHGLELNWIKTVLLPIRHDRVVEDLTGARARSVSRAVYLGSLLTSDVVCLLSDFFSRTKQKEGAAVPTNCTPMRRPGAATSLHSTG